MPFFERLRSAPRAVLAAVSIAAPFVLAACMMAKPSPDGEGSADADAGSSGGAARAPGAAPGDAGVIATPAAAPAPVDVCAALPAESTGQVARVAPETPAEAPPSLRLPEGVRPTQEALSLTIDPAQPRFSGVAAIALQIDSPRASLWLHGRDLHIAEAHLSLSGAQLPAQVEQVNKGGLLRVTLPCLVSGRGLLSIAWDAAYNEGLAGLYVAHEKGVPYAFTQFEATDARRAFPSFDDPFFKIPWDVELTVPADDVAISNDNIVSESAVEAGMRRIRFSTTPPLPAYLIAFAVGPFDVINAPALPPNDVRDHPLPIRGIVPKGRGAELKFALEANAAILTRLESWFGIPYPYEKLDHIAAPDFAAGAMENAGAIVYRETALLFQPGLSAPRDEDGIALTMAHEMAHQWFGDLVTLRWWTDTWLNESFATWMENKIVDEWRPEAHAGVRTLAATQRVMGEDATATARAVRKPVLDEASIAHQFDQLTYQKGAGLLLMIEKWIGPEKFRAGIQKYLRAHANAGGSSDDLFAALSEAAGRDVATPMRTFLEQGGIPRVRAKVVCAGNKAKLELTQERDLPLGATTTDDMKKQLWQIPVCIRASANKQSISACTLLTEQRGELELGKRCPDWVMPNEGANGYYRFSLDAPQMAALVRNRNLLSERERSSVAANLVAAYDDGTLPAAEVGHALAALTHDKEPEVSGSLISVLTDAHENIAEPSLRPAIEAFGRSEYAPLAGTLGWAEKPDEDHAVSRQRTTVLDFLAFVARDPSVRAEGLKLGRAYANVAGDKFDDAAVSPAMAGTALAIAVQEGGPELREKLIARLGATEQVPIRRRIFAALASVRDPALVRGLLDLSFDPRLRKNERLSLLFGFLRQRETRASAHEWLERHWDAMVAALPSARAAGLVGLLTAFNCDEQVLAETTAFLQPKLAALEEAKLSFEQGTEEAQLCIARRAAQGKSVHALFAKGAAKPAAAKPAKAGH